MTEWIPAWLNTNGWLTKVNDRLIEASDVLLHITD
jgi:hypothetical protein